MKITESLDALTKMYAASLDVNFVIFEKIFLCRDHFNLNEIFLTTEFEIVILDNF